MKSSVAAVLAAVAASWCCLGPVVFAAIGSGALAAASTKLAPVRPISVAFAAVLLGVGFYRIYRAPCAGALRTDDSCARGADRKARVVLWIAAGRS